MVCPFPVFRGTFDSPLFKALNFHHHEQIDMVLFDSGEDFLQGAECICESVGSGVLSDLAGLSLSAGPRARLKL